MVEKGRRPGKEGKEMKKVDQRGEMGGERRANLFLLGPAQLLNKPKIEPTNRLKKQKTRN